MAKYFGLLLCIALIHTAYSLKCYNCVSKPGDTSCDNFDNPSQIKPSECGKSIENMKPACIKKVIQDKQTNTMNTTRACILMRNVDNTETECKPTSDRVNVISCDICFDDLCNSSDSLHLYSPLVILGTIATYFFVRY